MTEKTFDLTTLTLSAGTHEITVKARASGYKDSVASNAVSYTVVTQETALGTWIVDSGWSATAGYGLFNIEGALNGTPLFVVDDVSIGIGWWTDGVFVSRDNYVGYYKLLSSGVGGGNIYSDTAFTLTITGGEDANNPNLIAWLKQYGKKEEQEETVQVSGTWYFNSAGVNTFFIQQVRFSSGNGIYTSITVDNSGDKDLYYGSTLVWSGSKQETGQTSKWTDEAYRTITFDGEQTVSKEFYEWLTANAVKQEPQLTPTEGLAYELSADGTYYTCTGIGTATDTDIVIASEIDGIPVKEIGDQAFNSCYSLTSVTIGDSVTSIGGGAFLDCSSLTSVVIPDSVTRVRNAAFMGCSSLKTIKIPNSVTRIDEAVFGKCHSLTSFEVGENSTTYQSIDGNLYSKDGKTLIQYAIGKTAAEFVIPDSVTSIGGGAFYGSNKLTSVAIPNKVTNINSNAFIYCSSLASITIPDSVTTLGSNTFENCYNLKSVVIGNSVNKINMDAFRDCISLTDITFNGTVVQWLGISKGANWRENVPATYVQCTNGKAYFNGTVTNEIAFTIDGTSYTALSGMTWGEWVASDYNTLGADIIFDTTQSGYFISENGIIITDTAVLINANSEYTVTAQISGTWVFNETLSEAADVGIGNNVAFTSNNEQYARINYSFLAGLTYGLLSVYTTDGGWINDAYRTITFNSEQTVSKKFYDWLNANAMKKAEEIYEVSGTWKFEGDYLPALDVADITHNVRFISNGIKYTSISIDDGKLKYDDTVVCEYYPNKNVWINEAYRTITFEGWETVSKSFYNFLTKEAVQQGVRVSGTWYFNEEPTKLKIYQRVKFVSNGETFYGIYGVNDSSADLAYYISSANDSERFIAYVSSINNPTNYGWEDQAYRMITFVDTQAVSEEFYEWLTENAVRRGNITFTIKDENSPSIYNKSFYADDGMTWGEWCSSEFNTDGYYVKDNRAIHFDEDHYVADGAFVYYSDKIIANRTYEFVEFSTNYQ